MLIEVVAPDEPLLYAEARRWHDPSAGIVCASLPPVASRASDVLGAIVAAAGGVPLHRSPANEDQAVESAVARLRAHRIHTVVAMHSQWLPDRARAPLAGAAAIAGVWLILVTHEFHSGRDDDPAAADADPAGAGDHYATDRLNAGPGYAADALDPWRDAQLGWAELRSVMRARATLGGVDRAALDAPMPMVGLAGPRPVAGNAAASPVATATYDAVMVRARRGSGATATLRSVLRDVSETELDDALAGAAAGLGESGYGIVRARVAESSRRWRDLWRISSTSAAAALVLRSCRISDTDAARLRVADVAEAGDLVVTRRRSTPIPAGAMPFLRAQRLVAGPSDRPFLLDAGQPVGPIRVDRLVREGLAALGLEPPSGDRGSDPAPSAAWLLERGIAIRGAGFAAGSLRRTYRRTSTVPACVARLGRGRRRTGLPLAAPVSNGRRGGADSGRLRVCRGGAARGGRYRHLRDRLAVGSLELLEGPDAARAGLAPVAGQRGTASVRHRRGRGPRAPSAGAPMIRRTAAS